ncbi:MAG: hypothetical protein UX09_C0005G0007 [Candidatus Uhrbacteria bacterium GW2011_GWE2_45_35]|uniref:DUF2188 domain-containing protein n=1 Tax=Candidatus Uhrbacteria bacterium GW2011_GWE2_45_35 TaxID=1618993 RepID=A0A0G1ML20_9BACT|nr:MAG: hypothetical protein UX09_C0005G0007 [Candidatus Uhrbacteria bacterium GW2011_GWE2_45_35]
MPNYHVTNKKGSDNWRIVKENADRASGTANTQKQAEQLAKQFAEGAGGGEVRIHRPNGGPIRDSDTVAPGRDPFPPRDKKN